jgi:hypothetical protein
MILWGKKMKLKFNDNLLTILLEKEEKVEEMLKSLIFDKLDFKKGVFLSATGMIKDVLNIHKLI